MWKKALVLASCFAAVACSGLVTSETGGEVVTESNLKVTVAVAGLTLGDEGCVPKSADAALCAPGAGAAAPREPGSGDVAPGCGGFSCRQTAVQLNFKATNEGSAAQIKVTKVTLLEENDTALEDLASSSPRQWTEAGYAVWNESIAPGAEVRSSYSLAAPAWTKHSATYTKRYKVRVTVQVAGETTTVDSEPTNREAPVAT